MHVLPRVAELHQRFENELVVIGVHAGKFPAERSTARIRSACGRLDVTHPVINDRQFRVWRSFAVEAWPTVVLVAPDGRIAGQQAGEFAVDDMAAAIRGIADEHRSAGTLDESPHDFGPDPLALPGPSGPLRYPGGVLADGERLFVSDTGHHRVLEMLLDPGSGSASIARAFGSGVPAMTDGASDAAAFHSPEGLALSGDALYVADRANHAVRAIGLTTGVVRTLAGIGTLSDAGIAPGLATATALRSPWDVAVHDGGLFIAMAGSHQLWRLDLATGTIDPFAGTGGEAISDGPARRALLAQPMGIAARDGTLAFCDAESSAVRTVTADDGDVRTLVGTGLFDFGDTDGVGDDALLQHVEALDWLGRRLVLTDTLNDKVKVIDPTTRECRALPGDAGSGAALDHPSGISASGARLFVADTDAHRIATVDTGSGAVATLQIL
jgi:hypothetical protein